MDALYHKYVEVNSDHEVNMFDDKSKEREPLIK